MKSISLFFQDFVERILIWLGYSGDMLDSLNRWVLLLFIVVFALAVDLVVRVILLHILRHIVSRTKATWDDHIFDKRVMRHLCNFITPTIYTKESRTYQIVCSIIDKIRIDFELARLARLK